MTTRRLTDAEYMALRHAREADIETAVLGGVRVYRSLKPLGVWRGDVRDALDDLREAEG